MGWEGRKRKGGWEGGEGRGGERGEDVEGPGKWSAPGPMLALGGPVRIYCLPSDHQHITLNIFSRFSLLIIKCSRSLVMCRVVH